MYSFSGAASNTVTNGAADELTHNAIWIGRVKVRRADKANFRGSFLQVAALQPLDVIEGDFTLKELNVLAQSVVSCAEDNDGKDQDVVVFLEFYTGDASG